MSSQTSLALIPAPPIPTPQDQSPTPVSSTATACPLSRFRTQDAYDMIVELAQVGPPVQTLLRRRLRQLCHQRSRARFLCYVFVAKVDVHPTPQVAQSFEHAHDRKALLVHRRPPQLQPYEYPAQKFQIMSIVAFLQRSFLCKVYGRHLR